MKKGLLILFCAAFFAFCAFFSLGMLIPGASSAVEGSSGMPALIGDDGINNNFGDEFEDWLSKSFAYRSKVVSAFSAIRETVFRTGNDQVTVGRESFLFFNEGLAGFTGEEAMTDEEIAACAAALDHMAEYAADHGAKFLFVCAPGKETIYPEMLPARFRPAAVHDIDRLYAALSDAGVDFIDLRPTLLQAKEDALLYHKRDSHWNGRGAAAAFGAITDALELPRIDFGRFSVHHDFEGDLDRLLYPGEVRFDDDETQDMSGMFIFTSAYSTPMDMMISTRSEGEGKLLIFRDSFANAMIPYFSATFAEVKFERANPYRLDLLEGYDASVVIVEITERNLRDLIGADEKIPASSQDS